MAEELGEAGGDWGTGAGGYSSSVGDNATMLYTGINGITPNWYNGGKATLNSDAFGGVGASYYTEGYVSTGGSSRALLIPAVGGQGGLDYGWFVGGSGGVAGKGGTIKVSNDARIYAFNGDRITNNDYTAIDVNFDASEVLTNKEGNFIEAKIYAQNGVLRPIYCITAKWNEKPKHNYEYFSGLFGSLCAITGDYQNPTNHDANYANICVRNETSTPILSYINPITGNCQGIGSGAGYIELSNGTYTIDSSMN